MEKKKVEETLEATTAHPNECEKVLKMGLLKELWKDTL